MATIGEIIETCELLAQRWENGEKEFMGHSIPEAIKYFEDGMVEFMEKPKEDGTYHFGTPITYMRQHIEIYKHLM